MVDDTVYIGSLDNYVYALSAGDGTEQWRFQTGDGVWSSPAVVDGTVYVGCDDTNVYAITGETPTATSTQTATRSGDRDGRDDSDRTDESGSSGSSGSGSTSGTETSTAVPDAISMSQQRGTAASGQDSSNAPFGLSAFTQFGDSETTLGLGGVAALLGVGGGYAAYRRLRSDDEE